MLALLALLAFACLSPGGCGPASVPPAPLERLTFVLAADATKLSEELVHARFVVGEEQEQWTLDAPHVAVRPDEVALRGEPTTRAIRMQRPGRYAAGDFNRVRVRMAFKGAGRPRLSVAFLQQGQRVIESEKLRLWRSQELQDLVIDLPSDGTDVIADSFTLLVTGDRLDLRIASIELLAVPPGRLLPNAVTGPKLVDVDDELRRGQAVVTGRALVTTLPSPPGARLNFSYTQPALVAASSAPSSLRLKLSDSRGWQRSLVLPHTEPGVWRTMTLPLDVEGEPPLRLRVEVQPEGESVGEAAWVFAEAAVRTRPGTAPASRAPGETVVLASERAPRARRPSVLLVTSDTHRGDHLGLADQGVSIQTPVLDGLAARGVFFEDCFSPINVTNPSHIGLMTGLHPRDFDILHFSKRLGDTALTLAEVYRDAGYMTFASLSVRHLSPEHTGLGQGFDRISLPGWDRHIASETIDVAAGWLADVDVLEDQPVFLWVHVFDAHTPYEPPDDFDGRYYAADRDPFDPALGDVPVPDYALPVAMRGVLDGEYPRAQYRAEITYMDRELARVIDHPRFADGVIAVVGDHGESLGEHDTHFTHADLYPQTLHVPLIVSWPGAPAGTRVGDPVMHLDLGRTLLELSGVPGQDFPGRNLVAPSDTGRRPEPRFGLASLATSASVQWGELYLILHLQETAVGATRFEVHQVELYDLTTDRACEHDLADQRTEDAMRMRSLLIDWLVAAPTPDWIEDGDLGEADRAQLRALGYADVLDGEVSTWSEDGCSWCRRFS